MRFEVPEESLTYWKRKPNLVQPADIDVLEKHIGGKAPESYRAFLMQFGAVQFDFDINDRFEYRYETDRPANTRERLTSWFRKPNKVNTESISFIKNPAMAIRYYDGLQEDEDIALPAFLVPFGMDYGQGELLIEFGQQTEKIYYWNFDEHDWETGETRIAFVADDFYQFINSLVRYDGPE